MNEVLKAWATAAPNGFGKVVLWLTIPLMASLAQVPNVYAHVLIDAATLLLGGGPTPVYKTTEGEFGAQGLAESIPTLLASRKWDEAHGGPSVASVASVLQKAGQALLVKFPDV